MNENREPKLTLTAEQMIDDRDGLTIALSKVAGFQLWRQREREMRALFSRKPPFAPGAITATAARVTPPSEQSGTS